MERAAGVILVKDGDDGPRMLCLRIYGSYDLPKGRLEDGESEIDAARRETSEEAGVDRIEFPWGHESFTVTKGGKKPKSVTVFLGLTDQEPQIRRNPESGEYEHHGIAWLSLDEAEMRLHAYLRPIVGWVRQKLDEVH